MQLCQDFARFDATFPPKEKHLEEGQLPQFCQSCGMPLTADEQCASNADGSICFDYCKYCFDEGKFNWDCTMEQMIDHCAQYVDELNRNTGQTISQEEYKQVMRSFFPMLKRWKSKKAISL